MKTMTAEQRNAACSTCHAKGQPITSSFMPGDRFFDHYCLVTLEDPDFYPGGQSRADFISKYAIARKEARETHYWLRLVAATGLANESETVPLIQECDELIAILEAIIKKAQSNKDQVR